MSLDSNAENFITDTYLHTSYVHTHNAHGIANVEHYDGHDDLSVFTNKHTGEESNKCN
jgi:hypothetical protein